MLPTGAQQKIQNGQEWTSERAQDGRDWFLSVVPFRNRCILAVDNERNVLATIFPGSVESTRVYLLPTDSSYESSVAIIQDTDFDENLGMRIQWFNNEQEAISAGYEREGSGRRSSGNYDCDDGDLG